MDMYPTTNAVTCITATIGMMSVADAVQQWVYIAVVALSALVGLIGLVRSVIKEHGKVDDNQLNKLQDDLDKLENELEKASKNKEDDR